jgi:hypothetical protein
MKGTGLNLTVEGNIPNFSGVMIEHKGDGTDSFYSAKSD